MPKTKRPATKRASTKQPTYRCVRRKIYYPVDAVARRRISDGDHKGERGTVARLTFGTIVHARDLPPEVFAACIRRGLIEEVPHDAKK